MKETVTHRQCKECLAWVPKSLDIDLHTCLIWIKALVKEHKKYNSPKQGARG